MLRFFVSLLVTFFMVGCGGGDSDSSNTSGTTTTTYTTATITHGGFDFSANKTMEGADGSTIVWADNGVYATGEAYDSGVWFRVDEKDSTKQKIYIYESSASSLDDVSLVDTTMWIAATDPYPSLKVGKIYVIKAMDGYVKFKVLSVNQTDWEADIEYKYSASTTF